MTGEMVETVRNEHILVDVKRGRNPLSKHVRDIVVAVSTVIELSAESALPLLRRDLVVSIRCVEDEAFELQFAYATDCGSELESEISVRFVRIGPLNKTNFRVEVGPDFSPLDDSIEPIRAVGERGANVSGAAACAADVDGRIRSGRVSVHDPVLEKYETGIDTSGLIE